MGLWQAAQFAPNNPAWTSGSAWQASQAVAALAAPAALPGAPRYRPLAIAAAIAEPTLRSCRCREWLKRLMRCGSGSLILTFSWQGRHASGLGRLLSSTRVLRGAPETGNALQLQVKMQLVREGTRRFLSRRGREQRRQDQRFSDNHPLEDIRQILLPPSSDTSRLPSGSCSSPTGRPHTSRFSGAIIHPVRKSRGSPLGLPPEKGTKATE